MKTVNKAEKEFIEIYEGFISWKEDNFREDLTELLNLQSQEIHEMYENNNPGYIISLMVGAAFGFGIIMGWITMNLIF